MTWNQCQVISFSKNYNWTNSGKNFCLMITPTGYLLSARQNFNIVVLLFCMIKWFLAFLGRTNGYFPYTCGRGCLFQCGLSQNFFLPFPSLIHWWMGFIRRACLSFVLNLALLDKKLCKKNLV